MATTSSSPANIVEIEPLDRHHAAKMQRLVADARVTRYTPKPDPYPVGEAAREIEKAIMDREAGIAFCFAVRADGSFAGVCNLKEVTAEQGELGYWIGLPFWGKGVATRGARLVLDFAFSKLAIQRVVAHTIAENEASSRVLERLGFTFAGSEPNTHPKWSLDASVFRYSLTSPDWVQIASETGRL